MDTMRAPLHGLVLTELARTCLACPSQWDGTLADGRPLYIRYRWGRLCVHLDEQAEEIFRLQVPGADRDDGSMELDELLGDTGLTLAPGLVVAERWEE